MASNPDEYDLTEADLEGMVPVASVNENSDYDLLESDLEGMVPFGDQAEPETTLLEDAGEIASAAGAGIVNATLGMSESVWNTPNAMKRGYGALYSMIFQKELPDEYNPISYISEGFTIGDTRFAGTSDVAEQISGAQKLLPGMSETFANVANAGREADVAFDGALGGEFEKLGKTVKDPKAWAGFIGQAVPSLFAAWKSGGSISFMMWLEGMEGAKSASEFEKKTGQKMDDQTFSSAVMATGMINGLLEKMGLESILKGSGSLARKFFGGMAGEAATEGAQSFSGNLMSRLYDKDASLTKGMLPGMMGGAGTGGPAGFMSGVADRMAPPKDALDEIRSKVVDDIDTAKAEELEILGLPAPTIVVTPDGLAATEAAMQQAEEIGLLGEGMTEQLGVPGDAVPEITPEGTIDFEAPDMAGIGEPTRGTRGSGEFQNWEGNLEFNENLSTEDAAILADLRGARDFAVTSGDKAMEAETQAEIDNFVQAKLGESDLSLTPIDATFENTIDYVEPVAEDLNLDLDLVDENLDKSQFEQEKSLEIKEIDEKKTSGEKIQKIETLKKSISEVSDEGVKKDLQRQADILQQELKGEEPKSTKEEKEKKRTTYDSTSEDLQTLIRKSGGIDVDTETDWAGRLKSGQRAALLKGMEQTGKGAATAMTLDDLLERANEEGFNFADKAELEDALNKVGLGEEIYSGNRSTEAMDYSALQDDSARFANEGQNLSAEDKDTNEIGRMLDQYERDTEPESKFKPLPGSKAGRRDHIEQVVDDNRSGERRTHQNSRELYESMSKERLIDIILQNELTGIKGLRSLVVDVDAPWVKSIVSFDADSLKWYNDNMGHEVGDDFLQFVADALDSVTEHAYHKSGDEFFVLTETDAEAQKIIKDVNALLKLGTQNKTNDDGVTVNVSGYGITAGIGGTINEADNAMVLEKKARESRGERAGRGEFPKGVSAIDADGNKLDNYVKAPEATEQQPGQAAAEEGRADEEKPAGAVEEGDGEAQADLDAALDEAGDLLPSGEAVVAASEISQPGAKSADEISEAAANAEGHIASQAQIDAGPNGNYKKGHLFDMQGLNLAIENEAGTKRNKMTPAAWPVLAHSYGDVKPGKDYDAIGADGDQLDFFIKKDVDIPADNPIYVINQNNKDGSFDESKTMLGFDSAADAKKGYTDSYSDDFTGFGDITEATPEQYKDWLVNGDTTKAYPLTPELELTGQTEAEIQADEKVAEEVVKKESEAEKKAEVDEGVDKFALTGSEREADIAAAAGQEDLLAEKPDDTEATAVLDAANVRGKDRLDAMSKFRSGKYSLDDLTAAYPAEEVDKKSVTEMSEDEITSEIDGIGERIKLAREEAYPEGDKTPPELIADDLDLISEDDKSRLHELKQALPSTGGKMAEARKRNLKRAADRKAKKPEAPIEDVGEKPESGKILFSKSSFTPDKSGSTKGITKAQADEALKIFLKELGKPSGVKIFTAPTKKDAMTDEAYAQHKKDQVRGFYKSGTEEIGGGRIVLILEDIESVEKAVSVLRHEWVAHHGLNTFKPSDKKKIIDRIRSSKGEMSLKPAWNHVQKNYPNASPEIQAEELLAYMAENKATRLSKLWNDLVLLIQNALKKIGIISIGKVTKAEIIRFIEDLVSRIGAGAAQETFEGDVAYSKTDADQTNTEAFKKWFGDSKVVDEAGKPLVVYHGTSKSQNGKAFTVFDTYASNYGLMGQGGYFTEKPEIASKYTKKGKGSSPTVYPVYLSIGNAIDMDLKANPEKWINEFDDIESYHEGGDTNESWYRAAEDAAQSQEIPMHEGAEIMQDGLRAMGYDGITHIGGGRVGDGISHRVFIAFDPEQIKSAIGNIGTFDPADSNIMYSKRTPKEVISEIDKKAKGSAATLKKFARRFFTKEGLLPEAAFESKILKDSEKNVGESDISVMVHNFEKAMSGAYGVKYNKISESDLNDVNTYLAGEKGVALPKGLHRKLDHMRAYLDSLSGGMQVAMADMLKIEAGKLSDNEAEAFGMFLATEGEQGHLPKIMQKHWNLYQTIEGNKGVYLNRSYQAFQDEKWINTVKMNGPLMKRARDYIAEQQPELSPDEVIGSVNAILEAAYDAGNFYSLIGGSSKLGAKDTSIITKRKEVPGVIRELLGEYKDPKVNFVNSATKMQYFVANHNFLMSVREQGLGVFLFDRPTGDFAVSIAPEGSETMNPLNGLYSNRDFATGLMDATQREETGEFMRQVIKYNSMIKYGKTILSVTTQARNFQSAMMFTVMNGHFDWSHMKTAGAVAWSDMFTKKEVYRKYINNLISLGVIHNNPYSGEMKDALEDFMALDTSKKGILQKPKQFLNFMQKAYQLGDDFWKIVGFENEKQLQIEAGLSPTEAVEKAAYRIRNGYPTYSMVPKGIKFVRRAPLVGTFVSFPYEIVRTTYNQIGFIKEDIEAGNTKMATRRIIGMSLSVSAAYAASIMSMMLMGIDDDDDEAVRKLLPPWSRNSQLIYTGYDKNGMPTYYDISYIDPYTYLKKPLSALANGNNEGINEKIADAMMEMLEPFIGIDIGAGALLELYSNKKATGGQIWNEQDTDSAKAKAIVHHIRKAIQPGTLSNAERMILAVQNERTRTGKQYKISDELWALVGHRFSTLNIAQNMKYKSYEFLDNKGQAGMLLKYVAGSASKISPDEMKTATNKMLKARDRVYKDMIKIINAAKKLKMSEDDLYDIMEASGISSNDVDYMLEGEVAPWDLPKKFGERGLTRAILTAHDAERKAEIEAEYEERIDLIDEVLDEWDKGQ